MASGGGRRMSLKEISRLNFPESSEASTSGRITLKNRRASTPVRSNSTPNVRRESFRTPQMGSLRKMKETEALRKQCEALETDLEELRNMSKEREEGLRTMLQGSKAEVEQLKTKEEESMNVIKILKKDIEQKNNEMDVNTAEFELLKDQHAQAERELMQAKEEIKDLKKNLDNYDEQKKIEVLEFKKQREEAVIAVHEKELTFLKEVEKLKQDLNAEVKKHISLEENVDELSEKLRVADSKVEELEGDLGRERQHSKALMEDLEDAESNLTAINKVLKGLSVQHKGGLINEVEKLKLVQYNAQTSAEREAELGTELAKQRFAHAEDLAEMVVERACHRELAQQHQERIVGVLRAMRTGISVAQTKLEEYIQNTSV